MPVASVNVDCCDVSLREVIVIAGAEATAGFLHLELPRNHAKFKSLSFPNTFYLLLSTYLSKCEPKAVPNYSCCAQVACP